MADNNSKVLAIPYFHRFPSRGDSDWPLEPPFLFAPLTRLIFLNFSQKFDQWRKLRYNNIRHIECLYLLTGAIHNGAIQLGSGNRPSPFRFLLVSTAPCNRHLISKPIGESVDIINGVVVIQASAALRSLDQATSKKSSWSEDPFEGDRGSPIRAASPFSRERSRRISF